MDLAIEPLFDKVIIERIEPEECTAGGIWIPEQAKEKPQEGVVMAAGEGRYDDTGRLIPMQIKKGDRVYFLKYAGTIFKIDGKEYTVCKQDEIIGKVHKKVNGKSAIR